MAPRPPEPDPRLADDYDEATRDEESYEDDAYDEVIDVAGGDTVDGDLNGAPEVAALRDAEDWEGADALDALHGSEAEERREHSVGLVAARCRAELERRRDQALERLEESRPGLTEHEGGASSRTSAGDPADAPDELETTQALEDQLVRIERALERLDSREYGHCLMCGERIPSRLLADEPEREACERCV